MNAHRRKANILCRSSQISPLYFKHQSPPALYAGAVAAGAAKAKGSWGKIFKLGVVSGAHIGFGSYLAISVGGACPGLAASNPGLQKVCARHWDGR
jgi:formate/nitrite transporter FocA (FNT family)